MSIEQGVINEPSTSGALLSELINLFSHCHIYRMYFTDTAHRRTNDSCFFMLLISIPLFITSEKLNVCLYSCTVYLIITNYVSFLWN